MLSENAISQIKYLANSVKGTDVKEITVSITQWYAGNSTAEKGYEGAQTVGEIALSNVAKKLNFFKSIKYGGLENFTR